MSNAYPASAPARRRSTRLRALRPLDELKREASRLRALRAQLDPQRLAR